MLYADSSPVSGGTVLIKTTRNNSVLTTIESFLIEKKSDKVANVFRRTEYFKTIFR
jgi:hypothetical protein